MTKEGCRIYEDRPWSCRMCPLGLASAKGASGKLDREFYFLLREAMCRGYAEGRRWTVSEWLQNHSPRRHSP